MALQGWIAQLWRDPRYWRWAFYPLAAFILFLSTIRMDYPVPASPNDKVNHFAAFLVLGLLLGRSYAGLSRSIQVALLLGYGLLIELIQFFLPHRTFSLGDLAADLAGILAAALALSLAEKRWP